MPDPAPPAPPVAAPSAPSSASGQERTAPECCAEVPADSAAPGASLPDEDITALSSGAPDVAENRSMVSLTRGPSQGAGLHRTRGARVPAVAYYPLPRPCRSAWPVVVLAGIPGLWRP